MTTQNVIQNVTVSTVHFTLVFDSQYFNYLTQKPEAIF